MSVTSQGWSAVRQVRLFGDPVETTPGRLKAGLGLVLLLAGLFAVTVAVVVLEYRQGLQTLGKDAAPSIIVAQGIRANLADMHSHAANLLLEKPGAGGPAAKDYERRRLEVVEGLLQAAGNVTYGDAERVPLRKLLDNFGTYQALIAEARTLHARGDAAYLAKHQQADRLHHAELLPAAAALDQANLAELQKGYRGQQAVRWGCLVVLVVLAAALLTALVLTQLFLARRMRRTLNPGLAAATVLAAGFLLVTLSAVWSSGTALRLAKEDAFDSIHALWQARADAYDANGEESRWLLDRSQASAHEKAYREQVARLVKLPEGMTLPALLAEIDKGKLPRGFEGHFATELNNITFQGERTAAVEALKRFARYVALDDEIRKLERDGKHAAAVALCLGNKPGESNWAFDQFDEALGKTIDINHHEFEAAITRGFRRLAGLEWWAAAVAVGVGVLAYLGLRPRLREYAL
jgi:hypothetical protein